MARVRERGEVIRRYILQHVQANPRNINRLASDHFHLTRQAVNQHLRRLVADGSLKQEGNTRSRVYSLVPLAEWHKAYLLSNGQPEDVVWRDDIAPALGHLPENVLNIWNTGFTEIFNNAHDHSEGTGVVVEIQRNAITTEMRISDDGIGIFRKIQKAMGLMDQRHAIFELSKGKLTTDPTRHSGEGIFFASRMFDRFQILSGEVFFSHEFHEEEDWLLEDDNPKHGTAVLMRLDHHTARTTKKVYDQYTSADDYAFSKTVVPVYLARYGNDNLVSRSQAKRVMARVEVFRTVLLDFREVPTIGQAFTDEVFRVFAREHPSVEIVPIGANAEVERMIERVRTTSPSPSVEGDQPAASSEPDTGAHR